MKEHLKLIFALLFISQLCYGQYCIDGNYCPSNTGPVGNSCDATATDEWAKAMYVVLPGGSSSCHVNELWAAIDMEEKNVVVAISRGNQGTATFLYYFNTDCDNTTGDTSLGQHDVPRNGAEYRIQIEVKNNGESIVEDVGMWDGTGYGVSDSEGIAKAGASDGCNGTLSNFVEFSFPLSEIFDYCNSGGCGAVEITLVESKAGGALTSSACDEATLTIPLTANLPPNAEFALPGDTLCRSAVTGEWPGFFIDASATHDEDIGVHGDSLDYVWTSNLEDDAIAFSNPSGSKVTNMNSISTYYQTTQAGFHFITLTVTDNFECESSRSGVSDPSYRVLILDSNTEYCALLPITLSAFDAQLSSNNATVQLNWTTESELNSSHFNVMRKLGDYGPFEMIAQLNAAGSSNSTLHYTYHDEVSHITEPMVYYQLAEVDLDGARTSSHIVSVPLQRSEDLDVSIYPNPVYDLFHVQVNGFNEKIEMTMYNMNGQVIMQESYFIQNGNEIDVSTVGLEQGTYVLSFRSANQSIHKRIVLIK